MNRTGATLSNRGGTWLVLRIYLKSWIDLATTMGPPQDSRFPGLAPPPAANGDSDGMPAAPQNPEALRESQLPPCDQNPRNRTLHVPCRSLGYKANRTRCDLIDKIPRERTPPPERLNATLRMWTARRARHALARRARRTHGYHQLFAHAEAPLKRLSITALWPRGVTDMQTPVSWPPRLAGAVLSRNGEVIHASAVLAARQAELRNAFPPAYATADFSR